MSIVVVGAGPAGLAAAEAASASGQAVTLIDENPEAGGQIWRGAPAADMRGRRLYEALQQRPHVRFLFGARIVAALPAQVLLLEMDGAAGEFRSGRRPLDRSTDSRDDASLPETFRQMALADGGGPRAPGFLHVEWSQLIICSGARELLLPFPGWTLPGVTGAGGLQALIKGGLPVAGRKIVIGGSGPLLLASAATAAAAGAHVSHIAEHASVRRLARFALGLAAHPAKAAQALRLQRQIGATRYLAGTAIVEARGDTRLRSVVLRRGTRQWEHECDYLAAGFGLVPETALARLIGCATEHGAVTVDGTQQTSQPGVFAAGECTGIGGVDKSLAEGRIAGLCAAGRDAARGDLHLRTRARAFAKLLGRSFALSPALRAMPRPDTLVCRCEDVRLAQLAPHAGWRDAKLQTRLGMGPCQGRVCASACEFLFGWDAPGARQPLCPTTAATLASVSARSGGDS
jgi:NADPH-dependent 2,4-dienoyl-CoA reductase/sulfur reductase-like enzyme